MNDHVDLDRLLLYHQRRLDNREGSTTLILVPGHKGILGNGDAEELTKAADAPPQPISFVAAKALIRCTVTDPLSNSHSVRTLLLEGRLHRHIQQGRCPSPSPPTHVTSQGVRPLARSGSRAYVSTVQGGTSNSRTLAAEMSKSRCPLTTHLW